MLHPISRASKVADMFGATGMAPVGLMRAASGAGGYFFGGLLELGGTVSCLPEIYAHWDFVSSLAFGF